MIILKVEDYCHSCSDFEADVDVSHYNCMNVDINNTLVTCKHCERCASHIRYLEMQKRKEEENDRSES